MPVYSSLIGGETVWNFNKCRFLAPLIALPLLVLTPMTVLADYDAHLNLPPAGANVSVPNMPIIPLPDPSPNPNPPLVRRPQIHPILPPVQEQATESEILQARRISIQNGFTLYERPLTRREVGMDILGYIPVIGQDFAAHEAINEHIDTAVTHMIGEARRARARSIRFTHQIYTNRTNNIVSVVIYADVGSVISRQLVQSVNFDLTSGRVVRANDAMGMDIVSIAERILAERIRSNPARYYAAMSVNLGGQSFFRTEDELVFIFDEFQLSTARNGIGQIALSSNNIRQAVVSPGQYHMHEGGYNLKMIPLRAVLEHQLGYHVEYRELYDDEVRVEVWHGSRLIVEMTPGVNEYRLNGMMQRALETAPVIVNGRIYVPITFFDQILPLTTYSIDSFETVTFVSYVE